MISIPPGVGSWACAEPTGITQVLHSVDDFLAVVKSGATEEELHLKALHLVFIWRWALWKWQLSPHPRRIRRNRLCWPQVQGTSAVPGRQMGVDVNEAPSRISRMEMDPSLSDGQTIPLAYYYGGFLFFEYRESRTGLVG